MRHPKFRTEEEERELYARLTDILYEQKRLIELFQQTNNKQYLKDFEKLSKHFDEVHELLKTERIDLTRL